MYPSIFAFKLHLAARDHLDLCKREEQGKRVFVHVQEYEWTGCALRDSRAVFFSGRRSPQCQGSAQSDLCMVVPGTKILLLGVPYVVEADDMRIPYHGVGNLDKKHA